MKRITEILEERIGAAIGQVCGQAYPAMIRSTADAKFGDYQVNGVMGAAKTLKTNPRQLAEQVVALMNISDMCEKTEIAGPGFINLWLKDDFLAARLLDIYRDTDRLGVDKTDAPKTVVVDYSGPNIAKQMHVGHLRSTIIGDCIARLCQFQGHAVIRQNHIGDWGTQFGKVILGLWHICMAEKRNTPYYISDLDRLQRHPNPEDQETVYQICKEIRNRHEQDWRDDIDGEKYFRQFLSDLKQRDIKEVWPKILNAYQFVNLLDDCLYGTDLTIALKDDREIEYGSLSRYVTVMLQKGGKENQQEKEAWDFVKEITMQHCITIYNLLNLTLEHPRDTRGESDYNSTLPYIVADLKAKGLAAESDGAICVFPKGFTNKEGNPLPFIIQKSDGAFLYATTDLAALNFRIRDLKADKIIYVTDARQAQHFQMLFAAAKMADWTNDNIELMHVTFGTMLGTDGKPFKTRTGGTVKLKDLLEEAVERATAVVEAKNPELSAEQKQHIALAVGIGAVKYADYSNNRDSDFIFSFDKMLAMEGNTAPYMQYAYARIKSIERKAEDKAVNIEQELHGIATLSLTEQTEKDLAKQLISYDQAIAIAAAECRPNYLTSYLFDLAQGFSRFYNACPVLTADPAQRPGRLLLCDLTARTIRHGLSELLGIEVVEQM